MMAWKFICRSYRNLKNIFVSLNAYLMKVYMNIVQRELEVNEQNLWKFMRKSHVYEIFYVYEIFLLVCNE